MNKIQKRIYMERYLTFREIATIIEETKKFNGNVMISTDKETANAKNLLHLSRVLIGKNNEWTLTVEGENGEDLVKSVDKIIKGYSC